MLYKKSSSSVENSLSRITLIFQVIGIQYFRISSESLEPRTNGLTRRLKLFFVANIALVFIEFCAVIFAIYLERSQYHHHGNIVAGQIVQITSYMVMILVLATTILNSFFLRDKGKQIFKNSSSITVILLALNQNVDYTTFESEFKNTLAKLSISFVGATFATLIFIYQYNHTNIFLWGVVAVYPYFFLIMSFSYWTLLVRLIRENLRFVKECVVQLHHKVTLFHINSEIFNHDSRLIDSKLKRNNETYDFVVKLKRIYGIIYETTALTNKLIAVPICLFIILIVIANVSSGYKVFLSFKRDIPIERIAGKS